VGKRFSNQIDDYIHAAERIRQAIPAKRSSARAGELSAGCG